MKTKFLFLLTLFSVMLALPAYGQRDTVGNVASPEAGDGPFISANDTPEIADIQARFPGGDSAFVSFVRNNFVYPYRCLENGISGYVVLRFIVDKNGNVSDIRAVKETAACKEFTLEAIRVLRRSPRWIPGQANGKFVKSYRQVPIRLDVQ